MAEVEFPVRCPKCGWAEGYLRQVGSYDFQDVEVSLRCRHCQHEWTIRRISPPKGPPEPSDAE